MLRQIHHSSIYPSIHPSTDSNARFQPILGPFEDTFYPYSTIASCDRHRTIIEILERYEIGGKRVESWKLSADYHRNREDHWRQLKQCIDPSSYLLRQFYLLLLVPNNCQMAQSFRFHPTFPPAHHNVDLFLMFKELAFLPKPPMSLVLAFAPMPD